MIPLSGILPVKGVDVWFVQYLSLTTIFFFGVSLVLWKFNKYLSIFTIVCLFSMIFVANYSFRAILCLMQIDLACLAAYGISKLNRNQRRWILRAIVTIVLIQSLWVCVQAMNKDPIFHLVAKDGPYYELDDTVGFCGSRNQLGVLLATTGPVVLTLFPWILPLVIFGLWSSTTSSAWMAFIISCGFLTYFKSKKIFIFLVISSIIMSAVFFTKFEKASPFAGIGGRITPLKRAIVSVYEGKISIRKQNVERRITCNPIFGFGLGNFLKIFPHYQANKDENFNTATDKYAHLHNDIGEATFELGWSGLISILLLLLTLFIRFIKAKKTQEVLIYFSCLSAYLMCAMFIFPTHTAVSGMWLILFYGMYSGVIREQNEKI